MRLGPLILFAKTNSPRRLLLAAWHSPHSLTWRWQINVTLHKGWRPKFHAYRTNNGLQWTAVMPPCFLFNYGQQPPMWFRDMHRRASDELAASEQRYREQVAITKAVQERPESGKLQ